MKIKVNILEEKLKNHDSENVWGYCDSFGQYKGVTRQKK